VKPVDLRSRFDFLVKDIARLNAVRFDRVAREKIGLTHSQVRLLGTLATQAGAEGMTQQALAGQLEMTQVGVARMCSRMEAAGWIRRHGLESDRRVWIVTLTPRAHKAFEQALALADELQEEVLGTLPAARRRDLLTLLQAVHAQLVS
jgi:DNA-binding MarR family transcriptional regulator